MTFFLVFLTLAMVLTIEMIRRGRKKRSAAITSLVTEYPNSFDVFDQYFHPGHTWVEISDRRKVKVGIDDFAARIAGQVEMVELPNVGQTVLQGESLVVLHHGSRRLSQVAPISGRITEVNKKLQKKPQLLSTAPFEQGWLVKIAPTNLVLEIRNLLKGFAADCWRDAVRAQLIQLLSPKIGTVMQDGGQLVENLGGLLTDEQWNHLVQQFFPNVHSNQPQNKPQN